MTLLFTHLAEAGGKRVDLKDNCGYLNQLQEPLPMAASKQSSHASGSKDVSRHGMWSSRWLFVLAAAGSAVGLGNIWKFPYIAGENGGGAFVLVYLACVAAVGIPIMMAEVLMGREGRHSPINSMRNLVRASDASKFWVLIGWMGAIAGFLILSYYGVIAGWALFYVYRVGVGTYTGASAEAVGDSFNAFLADPLLMIAFQTGFMIITAWIVGRGVIAGIETAIRWFMPLLFLLLLLLLGYSVMSGSFMEGVQFMFNFNWDALTVDGFLTAMGQAFFTLSLGMGAIMAYGAYMPASAKISTTVTTVALTDTAIAVAAGLAIFPIVFANNLELDSGPGLMFVTLPLAFGQMPAGEYFGAAFFLLVSFAAITSAISLTEPAITYLVEEYNAKRKRVATSICVMCWILGLGTVFSFNLWSDVTLGERTIFDLVDYLSQNIMLPLGGFLMALFVGFVIPKSIIKQQLGLKDGAGMLLWSFLIRLVAPIGVIVIFGVTIYRTLIEPMLAVQ